MSRAQWSSWAHQLWDGLCRGLCETGTSLALQNGFAAPVQGSDTAGV